MAEKLSITIALNGAEEIKRQLAEVGKAGKDCFKDINDAAADVGGFNKLDPSVVTEKLVQTGVAGKDVAKVLNAVNQAGRMETLVNGIAAVEKGLVKVQTAASAMDEVLLKGLTRSIGMIARLLPAAFGAATVGAIVSTTKSILELDAAATKLGVSIGDLNKAREIFKGIGIDAGTAAKGVASFFEKTQLDKVKEAAGAIDEFGRSAKTGGDWLKILRDAARGTGEAADLARKKLTEMGQLDAVLSPAAKAIDDIKKSTMSLPDQLITTVGVLEKMGNTAERDRLIFANFDKDFGTRLIQILNAGIPLSAEMVRTLAGLTPVTQEAANAALRLSLEWEKLKNMFTATTSSATGLNEIAASLELIRAVAEYIGSIPFIAGSMNMGNTLRELQAIGAALTWIGQVGVSIWDGIAQAAASAWQTVIGWINTAIEAVKKFFSMGGGQAAGAGAQGMARGGLMGGRGSGTSDSNLAWLSRGEHVMPAYAVRQPGVLQLLEALRRSGGNMRSVLDRMGHFAQGGIVGGSGMSNVTIAFPGLPAIGGLRASGAVVDELRRAAALAQVRSGGRKPSRYT